MGGGRLLIPRSKWTLPDKGRMKTHLRRRQTARADLRVLEGNPVSLVRKVKALAVEVGGIKNLKQLVDLLAE